MNKFYLLGFFTLLMTTGTVLAQQKLGASIRIYSNEITNKAWQIDKVFKRTADNTLYDPTGTIAKYQDLEYLKAVTEGMGQVLIAGSNAFKKAEAEFFDALTNHPPADAKHVQMVTPPFTLTPPDKRCPYALLVKEEGLNLNWYFSSPFSLKPSLVRRLVTIDDNGKWSTNFTSCVFTDYFNDATNFPAHPVGQYPRTIRVEDPPPPAGVVTIIRDSHLHWGHPDNGMEWGGINYAIVDDEGTVHYTLTGVYTARVDNVDVEFRFKNGSTVTITPLVQETEE